MFWEANSTPKGSPVYRGYLTGALLARRTRATHFVAVVLPVATQRWLRFHHGLR